MLTSQYRKNVVPRYYGGLFCIMKKKKNLAYSMLVYFRHSHYKQKAMVVYEIDRHLNSRVYAMCV